MIEKTNPIHRRRKPLSAWAVQAAPDLWPLHPKSSAAQSPTGLLDITLQLKFSQQKGTVIKTKS